MDEQSALNEAVTRTPQVTVHGEDPFVVGPEILDAVGVATEEFGIVCATGHTYEAAWTGPRVGALLDLAGVDPETTHIVVESADDYRVAVPVRGALGGILAYLKDGEIIAESQEYVNRLVCPGTEGARDIKGASRIEPVTLDPGEDPESLENLFPEGERFTADREMDEPNTESEPDPPSA
ncbi:MAG: molybdopterin-dependent oxidoreductase [Halodesulfurarchaeum sp.]